MSADLHRRAFELFDELRGRPPEQRDVALAESSGVSAELAALVRSLLENDSPTGRFLGASVRHATADLVADLCRPEAIPLPPSIGPFNVVRLLGRGGFGAVYLAEQKSPRRLIAVKVLRPGLSDAEARRLRFEAEALARLSHPGIAAVYELGESGVPGLGPYLVMEYVDGRPIDEHVHDQRPTAPDVCRLLAHVADAVHHAHQRGVLHRDIAPRNILITPDARPKLIDFGLACEIAERREADRVTAPNAILGTVRYMSPEHLAREASPIDTRSDVFSLGVVAYELLAGRHPFLRDSDTLAPAVGRMLDAQPERPSRIDPTLSQDADAVLLRAIDRDPERRYQSASAFAEDLRRLAAGEPVSARPPGAVRRARAVLRRHRAPFALGLICVLVAAVAGVNSLLSLRREARAHSAAVGALEAVASHVLTPLASRVGMLEDRRRLLADLEPQLLAVGELAETDLRAANVLAAYWAAKGDVLRESGDTTAARTAYATAVGLHEHTAARQDTTLETVHARSIAIVKLGDTEIALGDRDAGIARYREALALDEAAHQIDRLNIPVLSNLFWSYHRMGGLFGLPDSEVAYWHDRADAVAAQMMAIDPDSWRSLQAQAYALIRRPRRALDADPRTRLNHFLDAIRVAERTVEAAPENQAHHGTLVVFLEEAFGVADYLGDEPLMEEFLERAQQADALLARSSTDAWNEAVYRGRVAGLQTRWLVRQGRHEEALALIDRRLLALERLSASERSIPEVVQATAKALCLRIESLLALGRTHDAEAQLPLIDRVSSQARELAKSDRSFGSIPADLARLASEIDARSDRR